MDALYPVLKSKIVSFGALVDVKRDGNCFFTALWEAKHQYDVNKSELDTNDQHHRISSYASKIWKG